MVRRCACVNISLAHTTGQSGLAVHIFIRFIELLIFLLFVWKSLYCATTVKKLANFEHQLLTLYSCCELSCCRDKF